MNFCKLGGRMIPNNFLSLNKINNLKFWGFAIAGPQPLPYSVINTDKIKEFKSDISKVIIVIFLSIILIRVIAADFNFLIYA